MTIDTHAHLNFNAYKDDVDEVVKKTLENDIWMVNVGSQYSTSKRAVEIAERYESGVYAAVGIHPIHLDTGLIKVKVDQEEIEFKTREEEFDYEKYKGLAKSPRVVAIGEIGLDYWYKPKTRIKLEQFKKKQKETFLEQLKLAKELNLPVIFHCRMAHNDLLQAIKEFDWPELRGVVHCFTGTWQDAQKYLEMGFYVGFNGIIFKFNVDEVIKNIPLDKMLIETDCPYLTPPISINQQYPHKSAVLRNEPIYLKYIVEKIAKIKNLTNKEIADITTQNARKLFKI